MIKYSELMIGDYVLVKGKPHRVESITKKKIGYHLNPQTDKRLYYARLHDVEPMPIKTLSQFEDGFLINDNVILGFETSTLLGISCELSDSTCRLVNNLGEILILRAGYVHSLQHVVRMLFLPKTIKI